MHLRRKREDKGNRPMRPSDGPRAGLRAAIEVAVALALVPSLLISLLRPYMPSPSASAADQLIIIMIAIGLAAAALAFMRNYNPKGSTARTIFGLTEGALVLLYLLLIWLGPELAQMLSSMQTPPDRWRLLLTFLFPWALLIAAQFADMIDARNDAAKDAKKKADTTVAPTSEYSMRIGNGKEAQRDGVQSALGLIVFPLLLLLLLPPIATSLTGSTSPQTQQICEILSGMANSLLLLGLVIVPLAWLRGFYPRGSLGGLTFALAFGLSLVIYVLLMLSGHGLDSWLRTQGIHFDYALIVLLLMLLPLFGCLKAVGEHREARSGWKQDMGYGGKERRLNADRWLHDLDPRIGCLSDAADRARKAYIAWLIVPFLLLTLLAGTLDDIHGFINGAVLAEELLRIAWRVLLVACFIVALSFMWGFYPKGSYGRMAFGLSRAPLIVLYTWMVFGEGSLQAALWNSNLKIDLSPVVGLFLFYAAFSALTPICEMIDNRRTWKKLTGKRTKDLVPVGKGRSTDFYARFAEFVNGSNGARRKFFIRLVLPMLLIVVVRGALISINDPRLIAAADSLKNLDASLFMVGLMIVAVSFFWASYGRGSFSRLTLGLAVAGLGVLWTYIYVGGLLTTNSMIDISIPGIPFQLKMDFGPVLVVIVVVCLAISALEGFKALREYWQERESWLRRKTDRMESICAAGAADKLAEPPQAAPQEK